MYKVLFVGLLAVLGSVDAAPPDKVLMSSVSSLTFYKDRWTTGRRSSPVPQLSCVSGSCSESPSVVQCVSTGWDGKNPQWKCEANLPSHLKLGPVEVSCEGYDYPAVDLNFLSSRSQAVATLTTLPTKTTSAAVTTDRPQSIPPAYNPSWDQDSTETETGPWTTMAPQSHGGSSWLGELVAFVVFVGIFYLVFKTCMSSNHNESYNTGYPSNAYPSAYPAAAPYAAPASGPGFWSGFGLGSLFSWRPRWGYGGGYGGYGGYGYGGYGGYSRPSYTSSYRPSYSSSSRPSTSFGGTRRR